MDGNNANSKENKNNIKLAIYHIRLAQKNEDEMQWMANGIILAYSTFITDRTVDKESVIHVLSQASITKDELDK